MKQSNIQKLAIVMILVIFGCSGNSSDEKYLGQWQYMVKNTPNGDDNGIMTISKSQQGVYSGELSSSQGTVQLTDVSLSNGDLSSGFYLGEAYLSLTGSFDEETFKGEVKNDTESFPIDATKMAVLSAGKSQKPEATITIGLNPERVVPQNVEMKFENGVALLPAHSLTILKVTEI